MTIHSIQLWTILTLAFLALLSLICYRPKKTRRFNAWQKSLDLNKHLKTYQKLYHDVDGFLLSRQARNRYDLLDYIYGEIEFIPFIALLSLAKPTQESVFYDLGSGIGKAVMACAMVYPVKKSVGIEILPELYQASCNQVEKLKNLAHYKNQANKIHFILGDFFEHSLAEANYIFVNSSSLFGATWEKLCAILNNSPNLEWVITTSKPLISTVFTVKLRTKIQMSWGIVPAFVHCRQTFTNKAIENIE